MFKPLLVNHSPGYEVSIYRLMLASKSRDWPTALEHATAVLAKHPDVPDVILLRALSEKKLVNDDAA